MPELSRFKGIVLYLQFKDVQHHNAPHVHVYYGEYEASVSLDGTVLAGALPKIQLKLVQTWLKINEDDVKTAWNLAVNGKHFDKIKAL